MVREFGWQDLEQVHDLWRTSFGRLKPEDAPERLAATLARNAGLFLVEEREGRVVGTVIGTTDSRRGFLYHVAVAPAFRRQGIASGLVREVTQRLAALGLSVIHLRVEGENADAIALYRSLGFTSDPPVMGMRLVVPSDGA